MLRELKITNFILISEQDISFGPGLNVMTGETGAGKSIILQAVQFLLGQKPKSDIIRTGASETEVQGLFDLTRLDPAVVEELPDIARGDELVIQRTLAAGGRGKVYINGRMGSIALLEELSDKIVNICSQNQHVRLLDPRYHLELVDRFGGLGAIKSSYRGAYDEWKGASERLAEREALSRGNDRRREELSEVIGELSALKPRAGMRAQLDHDVRRLSSAERLLAIGEQLSAVSGSEGGLIRGLQSMSSLAGEMTKLDSAFGGVLELLTSARMNLSEFESTLSRYLAAIDMDGAALEEKRDLLAEIARLERKYRRNDEGLQQLLESSQAELAALSEVFDLERAKKEVDSFRANAESAARSLTKARAEAADRLSQNVASGLKDLAMGAARLKAEIEAGQLAVHGADKLELLISTNPGEPLKPLRQIASGGELSRLMLVLKQALRDHSGVNVLVFDEVDTGVSGKVARAIGEKLRLLSRYSQVICITHLPQIASLADHHFLVGKRGKKRAESFIDKLSKEQRIEEIARMLAGYEVTDAARESARELLSS